jgi:hypothetical protein
MISVWMFARAPSIIPPGVVSVPVICPADVASRLHLTDCEDRPRRVYADHAVDAVELRGWRWVAGQVYPRFGGRFPWELADVSEAKLHG